MLDRESRLPLLLGVVFAVLLHAALVPVWGIGISGVTDLREPTPPKEDQELPQPKEPEVGRADRDVTNIAWIAYDDFEELLARHSVVEQPALQRQEEPVPGAPIELDPTPPAPDAQDDQPIGDPGEDAAESSARPVAVSPVGPVQLPEPEADGELPHAPKGPMPSDTEIIVPDVAGEQTAEQSPGGQTGAPARPTGAPRDEGESPPVTILPDAKNVRPGKVLTMDGVEIKTVVPRPSIPTYFGTVPRNPKAVLWFNPEGRVTQVDLVRSTGVESWDDAVITALEQWKATGERIDSLEGKLKVSVDLILSLE